MAFDVNSPRTYPFHIMQLHHRFIETAKRLPGKTALKDRTTGTVLTYKKALIASLILAAKMDRYDRGDIGVMVPTSAGAVLAVLGALMSGRVPVMINFSTGAEENARFAREKCGFKTIITSGALLDKIGCPRTDNMVLLEDIMNSISTGDKIRAAAKAALPVSVLRRFFIAGGSDDDNALMLFTSGSEKDPKVVPLTHRNINANIDALTNVFSLSEEDIFLANLPYFHVLGQTANLWVPVTLGMTLVTYANPLDYKMIPRIVREEGATLLVGTPVFFWGYLKKSEPGDFETLRIALVGADKCPDALRRAWSEKHTVPLIEAYGTTETSPAISVNTPENNRPGSVGRPIPGMTVRIEDLDTGGECGPAEIGKVLVKGDSVMKGYLNDMEETSFRLRDGWYDTGDMGYLDEDGYLWLAGRLRRFVKIGGEMVSLVRIEDELEKLLPEEVGCCVIDVPDPIKGARIIAAVTCSVDDRAVLKQLSECLPAIALPKRFIVFEELPTMGSGKIDFRGVARETAKLVEL